MKKMIFLILLFCTVAAVHPQEKKGEQQTAYIIPIFGEINQSIMVFIRRGIEEAKKAGADYIIFEIDTFGGRVDSALQITTMIGSVNKARTIAYITRGPDSKGVSWSAGALISFSCQNIYMASGTSIGAAAPVIQSQQGTEPASEKVVSALRAQMASLAEKNGYSSSIVQAMVDKDIELIEVRLDDELRVIDSIEYDELLKEAGKKKQTVEKGKTVSKAGKLLTLTAREMEKYQLSSGTLDSIEDLYQQINVSSQAISRIEQSPSDQLVSFMTSSFLVSILVMLGLITLYMEISSPGFGIPGTIAIICFAIVFGSNALLGKVGSIELLLFMSGVILLIIEIFVIPGFGITGLSGIIFIAFSLIFSLQDFIIPRFDWQWDIFFNNIILIGMSLVFSFVGIAVVANVLPRSGFFNRLVLNTSQTVEQGYTVQARSEKEKLLGTQGLAVTVLRPAGKAEIEQEIYEVESDGEFIEKGQQVEVIQIDGNRIVVRKC